MKARSGTLKAGGFRRWHTTWLAVLCAATVCAAAHADVTVRTSVDKSRVTIGDRLTYTLTIIADARSKVSTPDLGINVGPFEIKDYHVSHPKVAGKVETRVDYVLATFETGKQEIPPVDVTYTEGGRERHVRGDAITIDVQSLAPSKAPDIKDIKPPVELPPNWSSLRLAAATVLGVLLLIGLLVWQLRRRRGRGAEEETVPALPAHVLAFQELAAIRDSSLLAEGRYKEYYSQVADALRRYLEGRYAVASLDETTAETLRGLAAAHIEPDCIAEVRTLLESCDLVKFAKYIPPDVDTDAPETLERVWRFVEQTRLPDEEDSDELTDEDESAESEAESADMTDEPVAVASGEPPSGADEEVEP